MQIFINDTPTDCQEQSTISEILSRQNILPVNIAIALDNTVIPKAAWDRTTVKEDSNLIIIKAVQGG